MASTDKTRIPKPSAIVEDEQGQLVARRASRARSSSELSKIKGEPEWMREKRIKSLEIFERKPIPTWGVDLSGLNLDDLVLYSPPDGRPLRQLGRRPEGDEGHLRGPRHPPGRARAPRRRRRRLAPGARLRGPQGGVRRAGNPLLLDGHRGHRVPGARPEVLHEQVRAAPGQQVLGAARRGVVGRLVPLRAQGREGRPSAAGVLPHGGRRRGHLRAHADHRRRGLRGELHRGLHGADLQRQLDALGGRRDLRARRAPRRATRPSRTGPRTSTTSTPSARSSTPTAPSSGSAARWAPST